MQKRPSRLAMGLIGLTGLLFLGCGSDDETFTAATAQTIREFIVIPNLGSNTVSVRAIDIGTGATVHVSAQPTGTTPTMVRTHPTRNIFYVTNTGSNNISGFSIDANGGTSNLPGSPFAGPTGSRSVHIHPSGQFVYVAGTNTMQTFQVNQDGSLTSIGTVATPAGATPRNDGGFSSNGQFLHIPVNNGVLTFTINQTTGVASTPVNNVIGGIATTNDLSIHPNNTLLLVTCQVAGANNDIIVPFTIGANGVLTAGANQVQTSDVGLGQIARNGIYYVGDLNNPLVRGFNVSAAGVLTAITGSPFSTPGGGSQAGLDPTESLVYSAPNGTGLAGSRRLTDNTLQPAANSPVTDNMNNVFAFDFFQFVFQQ